ncbi:MAG: ion channel [Synechococcaceae cyanobacterium]
MSHPPPKPADSRQGQRHDRARLIALERQFVPLLVACLLPILLLPLTAKGDLGGRALLATMITLLSVQVLRTLPRISLDRHAGLRLMLYRGIAALSSLGCWVPVPTNAWPNPALRLLVLCSMALFFLTSSLRLVNLLARVPRVNLEVLAGAAAGYLLLGLTGGVVATATQVLQPGSFSVVHGSGHELVMDRLTYFSFITIGGLGYGDILPTNALGERFAILLSVSSTLYLTVLMGLLLGRFLASGAADSPNS